MTDFWRSTILNRILLMIRLTLYLWSKLSDPTCLEECQKKLLSSFTGSHHDQSVLNRSNVGYIVMHDVKKKQSAKTSVLALLLFFSSRMIRLTLHLWSKLPGPRCSEGRQSKASFFLHWITSRSISVEPIECWLHHDAWCKHWRKKQSVKFWFYSCYSSLIYLWISDASDGWG